MYVITQHNFKYDRIGKYEAAGMALPVRIAGRQLQDVLQDKEQT
jgi:hypothetical protein